MQKIRAGFLLSILFFILFTTSVLALSSCPREDPCQGKDNVHERIDCYTDMVDVCSAERESMTSQVISLTTKIALTSIKIAEKQSSIKKAEQEIVDIAKKIENLELSLTKMVDVLIDRVKVTYKNGKISYFSILLSSSKFSDVINRFRYYQTIQSHDRRLVFQLQNSKSNFKEQKDLLEEKKQELDLLKRQLEKEQTTLAMQKKEKELFLEATRNSESRYRQELASAKREAEGIQQAASILSSAGVPRKVLRGDRIGTMGNTGFSTGAHLHFAVYNLRESDLNKFNFNSSHENPLNMLSSRQLPFEPTSCDDASSAQHQTRTVGTGSWEWPMSDPTISQCYGHTPWSWRYQYGIHNGLDMWDDSNKAIKAVENGNAYFYRGGQSAGNGVFIFHENGKMTLYWHLE